MIENVWQEAPPDAAPLLALARAHGWRNLPVCLNDVRVAWKEEPVDAPAAPCSDGISLPPVHRRRSELRRTRGCAGLGSP